MALSEADLLLKRAFDVLSSANLEPDLLLAMASYLRTQGVNAHAAYPVGPMFTLIPTDPTIATA